LIKGNLGDKPILVLQGRFHYYQGYTMRGLTFPVWVLAKLGIEILIQTSAVGSLRPRLAIGDFVIVDDYINLMGTNPLIGFDQEAAAQKFLNTSEAYSPELMNLAKQVAKKQNIRCHAGVLAAVAGPVYETRAEAEFLQRIGADIVGMSTIPETMVAAYNNMKQLAISLVANLAGSSNTSHKEVLEVSKQNSSKLGAWLEEIIANIPLG
jgi:purine-nucleoside phosphorylase